jgi:hypothetical protein
MARIIKKAQEKKAERVFRISEPVAWQTFFHDGRSYETKRHTGVIVKVCKVNLHVQDAKGNIWEVLKSEAK